MFPSNRATSTRPQPASSLRAKQEFPYVEGQDVPIEQDVLVVGGGLSGLLAALLLGRQGMKVHVYEKLLSPFDVSAAAIDAYTSDHEILLTPLALEELDAVGIDLRKMLRPEEDFVALKGVAIHSAKTHRSLLAAHGEESLSVSTTALIKGILKRISSESLPVTFHWGTRVEIVNSSRRLAVVSPMGTPGEPRQIVNVEYKMLIGADGRSSTVRRCLEDQVEGMAFEQATDQARHHFFCQAPPASGDHALASLLNSTCGVWAGPIRVPGSPPPTTMHVSSLPGPRGTYLAAAVAPRFLEACRKRGETGERLAGLVAGALPGMPRAWASALADAMLTTTPKVAASQGLTTRGTRYHGPREALVGDAAHAMVPSLWLASSASVLGVVQLARVLAEVGADAEKAASLLPQYSRAWLHDAFSAAEVSEQIFEDPRPRSRIPQRFRAKERHIERLVPVEAAMMLAVSRLAPFLVPPPGIWRLLHSRDSFSAIFRDMRSERSLSTRALLAFGAACCLVLLFIGRVIVQGTPA